MDSGNGLLCSKCESTKRIFDGELDFLRTSFVEYKKRVISIDKLFTQVSAKRSQVAKIEEKLNKANNALRESQEQLKSTLLTYEHIEEKCSKLEVKIVSVTAERDDALCHILNLKQQKAALEDKLETALQKLQTLQDQKVAADNRQMITAHKMQKLEAHMKDMKNQKASEKLPEKSKAQELEVAMLKKELEERLVELETLKKELDTSTTNKIDGTLAERLKLQEIDMSNLREELQEKLVEIKTMQEKLVQVNEESQKMDSLVDKLGRQETECDLLRSMITEQHNEMELLKKNSANTNNVQNLHEKLVAQENVASLLRQELQELRSNTNSAGKQLDVNTVNAGAGKLMESLTEQELKNSLLVTELEDRRKELEVLRNKLESSDVGKLIAQLATKEQEASLLRKEMEEQQRKLDGIGSKLGAEKMKTTVENSEQISENIVVTAGERDEACRLKHEMAALKLQLSTLQAEVKEKTKEILKMKDADSKEIRRKQDLEEKWRMSETRTYELVAELAQLKAREEGTSSAIHKCTLLEKMLNLRDSQITKLKAELKGVLVSRRPDSRKPNGEYSASSGRGSCDTPDLDDMDTLAESEPCDFSVTRPGQDSHAAHEEVGEILRRMTVPPLISPIYSPKLKAPAVRRTPYDRPPPLPEQSTQEMMLLALVESVRSAMESYEKLYGARRPTSLQSATMGDRMPEQTSLRKATISSFKVVDEWIKDVSPDFGAERSCSDEFSSVGVGSSKDSVRELKVLRDTCKTGLERKCSDGAARQMSTSFSGRRGGAVTNKSMLPKEVVALSRKLNSVPLKINPHFSSFTPIRKSLDPIYKEALVVNKTPTMATLCQNLNVSVPSQFVNSSEKLRSKITSSSECKLTARCTRGIKSTKEPTPRSIAARKLADRKKFPSMSESFVLGTAIAANRKDALVSRCVGNDIGNTKTAAVYGKNTRSSSLTRAPVAKSAFIETKPKKKRKAVIDTLFGSDGELQSPSKKTLSDAPPLLASNEEKSILVDTGKYQLVPTITSTNPKELPPSNLSVGKSSVPLVPSGDESVPPSETSGLPLEDKTLNDISDQDPVKETTKKTPELEVMDDTPDVLLGNFLRMDSCTEEVTIDFTEIKPKPLRPQPEVEGTTTDVLPKNEVHMDLSLEEGTSTEKKSAPTLTNDNSDSNEYIEALAGTSREERNSAYVHTELREEDKSSDKELVIAKTQCETKFNLRSLRTKTSAVLKMVSFKTERAEDTDSSDDELVIADSDLNDASSTVVHSASVKTKPMKDDDSSDYDSDDEPLSSLLNSSPKRILSPSLQASPIPILNNLSMDCSLPINIPPRPATIKLPFFYMPQEENPKDELPPVTLHISNPACELEGSVPVNTLGGKTETPGDSKVRPVMKLRDEKGIWNRRVYVTLADKEGPQLPPSVKKVARKSMMRTTAYQVKTHAVMNELYKIDSAEDSAQMLEKMIEALAKSKDFNIVKEVISQATDDCGELEPRMPPEPQLTAKGRHLVTFMMALHKSRPVVTEEVLTNIELSICHLIDRPLPCVVERLISLHLTLCLRHQLVERQRTFLYDVLYCFAGNSALPFCRHILDTAPFALKHAFTAQDDVLSQTVAHSLLTGRNCENTKDMVLWKLVSLEYKYNEGRQLTAQQLVERMVQMLENGDTDFVEASLVLLAKRAGWVWANVQVVGPMRRLIDRWIRANVPFAAANVALRVISFVARTLPKSRPDLSSALFARVKDLLQCDNPQIHEPAMLALMRMGKRENQPTIFKLLKNYPRPMTEDFTIASDAYTAKFMPFKFQPKGKTPMYKQPTDKTPTNKKPMDKKKKKK